MAKDSKDNALTPDEEATLQELPGGEDTNPDEHPASPSPDAEPSEGEPKPEKRTYVGGKYDTDDKLEEAYLHNVSETNRLLTEHQKEITRMREEHQQELEALKPAPAEKEEPEPEPLPDAYEDLEAHLAARDKRNTETVAATVNQVLDAREAAAEEKRQEAARQDSVASMGAEYQELFHEGRPPTAEDIGELNADWDYAQKHRIYTEDGLPNVVVARQHREANDPALAEERKRSIATEYAKGLRDRKAQLSRDGVQDLADKTLTEEEVSHRSMEELVADAKKQFAK